MSRTRPEIIKAGVKPAAKMYSTSLLKESTRLGPASVASPLKGHSTNLTGGFHPGTVAGDACSPMINYLDSPYITPDDNLNSFIASRFETQSSR